MYCVQVYNKDGEGIGNTKKYDTLREAEIEFDKCVKNYSLVVKTESKPVDDIWVYAQKIQYRKIDPDCCMNCEFSEKKRELKGRCGRETIVCGNPDNFKFYNDVVDEDPCRKCTYDNRGCEHNWWIHGELVKDSNRTTGGWELGAPPCDCSDFLSPNRKCPRGIEIPVTFRMDVKPTVDLNGICKNYKRRKVSPENRCPQAG